MPRRVTLTDRQREALFHLPVDQGDLLRHYTLSDEDLGHIRQRRRAHNRFGFALQLCVLRYPGRVLTPGELIPAQVSDFIAAQLGLSSDDLLLYAAREETRHEHLADLRRIYGYRSFSGRGARDLRDWIAREAEAATSNEDLARRFVAECRRTRTILPGFSTIERLCADALVKAERRIEDRIAGMNLLAAIIIFWNTMKLGEVVDRRAVDGIIIPPDLLAHVSPLGWEHINLTGEYRWPKSLA